MTRLSVRLISGQHLPSDGAMVEPYVKLSVHGHPADHDTWTSSSVPRNGFNPLWGETAEFDIRFPELALLEFKARNLKD